MIDRRASSRWPIWLAIVAAILNILFLGVMSVVLAVVVAVNSYYLFSFKKAVARFEAAAERAERFSGSSLRLEAK